MLHSHLLSMDSAAVTNALPPFNSNIHMSERKLIRLILEMIRNESQADSFVTTTKKTLIPYRDSQNYQRDALLYIVVVLFFYSVSLAVCMIKYMRKEAEESKDSQFTQVSRHKRLADVTNIEMVFFRKSFKTVADLHFKKKDWKMLAN